MTLKQISYAVGGIVIFSAFLIFSRLPKSETYMLTGTVTEKGTSQGYGPSGDRLVVEIKNGKKVNVLVHIQMGIRVGDSVNISAYDRYFFGPKYQMLNVVRE